MLGAAGCGVLVSVCGCESVFEDKGENGGRIWEEIK